MCKILITYYFVFNKENKKVRFCSCCHDMSAAHMYIYSPEKSPKLTFIFINIQA